MAPCRGAFPRVDGCRLYLSQQHPSPPRPSPPSGHGVDGVGISRPRPKMYGSPPPDTLQTASSKYHKRHTTPSQMSVEYTGFSEHPTGTEHPTVTERPKVTVFDQWNGEKNKSILLLIKQVVVSLRQEYSSRAHYTPRVSKTHAVVCLAPCEWSGVSFCVHGDRSPSRFLE